MSVRLAPGTKQYLTVAVFDESDTYSTLEGVATAVQFDVIDDADVNKYSNSPASVAGMSIRCLVDTAFGGAWAEGRYRLFSEFTVGSENVRLGPFEFYVTDEV
jgi:hypothetical protein